MKRKKTMDGRTKKAKTSSCNLDGKLQQCART